MCVVANQFPLASTLSLSASFRGGKTILEDVSYTAPFKVMRPFYTDKAPDASGNVRFMSVLIMQASPGVMAGDDQSITIDVHEGAAMKVSTQAYEKIFCMEGGKARRTTHISIAPSSCLYYTPLPVIPYAGSHFESTLDVELADGTSRFVLASVIGAGRVAHGECFAYTHFADLVRVRRGGKLVYRDNTLFTPSGTDMAGFGMCEGHTHSGTLALFGAGWGDERLDEARAFIDGAEGTEGGVTRTAQGDVVVRLLGGSGEGVLRVLDRILEGSS